MSERFKDGYFALVLAGLLFVAIVMFTATSSLLGAVRCYENERNSYASGYATEDAEEKCDEPQWWYWTTRLVGSEDGLAQWVMAILSVVAVGVSAWAVVLVKDTLEVTRDMAKDQRLLGEAQVAAHLMPEQASFRVVEGCSGDAWTGQLLVEIRIKNAGQTPAYNISAEMIDAHNGVKAPVAAAVPIDIAPNETCIAQFAKGFGDTSFRMAKFGLYTLIISYDNIFTHRGETAGAVGKISTSFNFILSEDTTGKTVVVRV